MPRTYSQRSRIVAAVQMPDGTESPDVEIEEAEAEESHEEEPETADPAPAPAPAPEAPSPAAVDTTGPSVYVNTRSPAPPSAHILPEASPMIPTAPTMEEAFTTMCQAMTPLLADNVPAQTHCGEIQAWYANDVPGSANHRMAWLHMVQLLEQVLNIPLMLR